MSVYIPRNKAGRAKSPYYHFDFVITLPNGERRRVHGSTGLCRKKDAEDFEDIKRKEEALGIGPGRMTVNEACWRYWSEIGEHQKASKDKAFQLEVIRRLLGAETRLIDLTKNKIADAIRRRAAEPRTVLVRHNPQDPEDRTLVRKTVGTLTGARINRSFIRPLSALLNRAESHWDVPINPRRFPWKDWFYPDSETVGRELSATEEERLWASIRPDYYPLLQFIANNGVRVGGALSMLKSRTNLERRETHVRRKTKKRGEHWAKVSLSPAAVALLATEMRKHNHDEVWTYVVQWGEHKGLRVPITYHALRSHLVFAFRRAGIKDFRAHDLRHDFGSKLLRMTKNLKLVQQKLHHSTIGVTAKFYAHVLEEEIVSGTELVEASRNYPGPSISTPLAKRKKA